MSTPLMWKSLDLYNRLFSRVWPIPIIWDVKKQRFAAIRNIKTLSPWLCVLFLEFVQMSSCFIFLAKTLFSSEYTLPFLNLLIFLNCVVLCFVGMTIGFCLMIYVQDIVSGLNELINLEIAINTALKYRHPRKTDVTGATLNLIAFVFAIYPFLITTVIIYGNLDPFAHFTRPVVIPTTVFFAIRIAMMIFLSLEVCRGFCFFLLVIVLGVHMLPHCITTLYKSCNRVRLFRLLELHRNLYTRVQLIAKMVSSPAEILSTVLLGIGLFFGVCFNFATFQLYDILLQTSVVMFLLCASSSAIIPIIVSEALPYAIVCHEDSTSLLRKWKYQTVFLWRNNRRYALKQLKSMQSIDVNSGIMGFRFFRLQKSTKSTYL